ncbi:MAG: DUF2520 domain-containing protein [Bacteroidia bacterium]|nr:DUF2520 domain-containing protein [Bacteroidia bacterium]
MFLVIGAGGVGQAVAGRFYSLGSEVCLVRRPHQVVHAPYPVTTDWQRVPIEHVKGVFLCVRDRQIASVAEELSGWLRSPSVLVHTAGSVPLDALQAVYKGPCGVMYPLQSFTVGYPIRWGSFPVFWEGASEVESWALLLTGRADQVCMATSTERLRIHIGAVFTANFLNALFHAADTIGKPRADWRSYLPLAESVLEKLHHLDPLKAQTGPAWRGDLLTIERHLQVLQESYPHLTAVYELLSSYIQHYVAQSSRQ